MRLEQVRDEASEPSETSRDAPAALIRRVGARVRAAREAKGLARRVLSERSGVSPRYLAQLEGGEGNISIGLLQRVATALERPVEALVADDDSAADEAARLGALYRGADAAVRTRVLELLDPDGARGRRAGRVCLIGLRGAGKSTLGARVAEALGVAFVELNREIERHAGIPVGEIIALYGDEGYRRLEADVLGEVVAMHERAVLAVAGGVVEQPETFAEVLGRFHTVWLRASPTEHMERVRAQGDLRPMAGDPRAMARLREILEARESRYRQAGHHLDTDGRSVEASASELGELIRSHGLLDATRDGRGDGARTPRRARRSV